MHRGFLLNPETVTQIKKRLWEGSIQANLAEEYQVSLGTVNKIVAGLIWSEVKWPDMSDGPMADTQRAIVMRNRQSARPARHASGKASRRATANLINLDLGLDMRSEKERYMAREFWIGDPPNTRLATQEEVEESWNEREREKEAEQLKRERRTDELMKLNRRVEDDSSDEEWPEEERVIWRNQMAAKKKMWKGLEPQFEFWLAAGVNQAEIDYMTDPLSPTMKYRDNREAILEWWDGVLKALKEPTDDHQ